MAPSFLSMLMTHNSTETRGTRSSTRAAATDTDVRLPHLLQGRSFRRTDGVQFGLPVFQHVAVGPTLLEAAAPATDWDNRQKVQDFFRHTGSHTDKALDTGYRDTDTNHSHSYSRNTTDSGAVTADEKAIDMQSYVFRSTSDCRKSCATSSTSSEDTTQQDDVRGAIASRGRLHSDLEDLLTRQEVDEAEHCDDREHEEQILLRREEERRRRYDSFDILADVRLEDEESDILMDDLDSVSSVDLVDVVPARSRTNSEDFYGGELLDMLSERHMPVGIARHASVADMLANRASRTSNGDLDAEEKWMQSGPEANVVKLPETAASLARSENLASDRNKALAEMLALSTGKPGQVSVDDKTTLEAVPVKQATLPSVVDGGALGASKVDPLGAMLAKRSGSSLPAQDNAQDERGGVVHPVAATLKQRQQAPAAEAVAPSDGDSTEMDGPPLKDHPAYQKYFKMLAVGLPSAVVKHKMQSESVDPAILDMDPSRPLPKAVSGPVLDEKAEMAYQAQLKEYESKHGKYSQMVKVGLPAAVVEHKMRMDGVDPSWLHGPPKRPEPKAAAAELEVTEEMRAAHRQKYHKYFQMLRMGLPRGAVEQKMRMAGLDPASLNGPRQAATPAARPKESLKRKNSIRKKLHWEGKKHRPRRDSLWGGDSMEETKEQVQISEESRAILEKLFVKDLTESKKPDVSTNSDGAVALKKKAMVQLIDMKKSQNIAITLARVKLTFPELKREILAMNPNVLSSSQVHSLMDMWPDRQEMEAIKAFEGDLATLGTAEQFLVEVRSVPRFHEKLACLVYKQEFSSRSHELRESLDLVTRGVDQVCSSAELRQLFIYILQIGNLLNFGGDTKQQGVNAFSLSSLVKFSQTKAFVGGTTFLQYVVQSIERDVPHLAQFYTDIDLILKCSNVAYASLASERNGLELGLQKVLREAESANKEGMTAYTDALICFYQAAKAELSMLQGQLDKLDAAKARFLEYFEEEDTEEELDVLLSHIANFTSEYRREHSKYLANVKKDPATQGSPSRNAVATVEPPKQEPIVCLNKEKKDCGELPQGEDGHHSQDAASQLRRPVLSMKVDKHQSVRRIRRARVLDLDMSRHDDKDGALRATSMASGTSVVRSGLP
ncbi:unnamed protein product [Hyaloperonospora brassicae]|uniref:FH2 domain-containing protein n=1 Tax=Hyaloperonospora brassicae TaxID=162125 RepID=A0AAV0UPX1_HYABA|nr:unnamed protein product [Hyaloperonospora brassicae]